MWNTEGVVMTEDERGMKENVLFNTPLFYIDLFNHASQIVESCD